MKKNNKIILYKPKVKIRGTVLSHLSKIYLVLRARGEIIKKIDFI